MFADETGTIPLPAAAKLTKLDLRKQLKETLIDHCGMNSTTCVALAKSRKWAQSAASMFTSPELPPRPASAPLKRQGSDYWNVDSEEITQALGYVARIDLKMPPPNPQEERIIIEKMNDAFNPEDPGKVGTLWYLIPARWWKQWLEFTSTETNSREQEPPSIDNTNLVDARDFLRIGLCQRAIPNPHLPNGLIAANRQNHELLHEFLLKSLHAHCLATSCNLVQASQSSSPSAGCWTVRTAQRRFRPCAGRFGSYQEMFADPDVDVVYVGTVHPTHHQVALGAIRAGKHVLVEKPLCTTLAETQDLVAEARKTGVFLMEGLWTRCFPLTLCVKEILDSKRLGPVRAVTADFGFYLPFDASHRLHGKDTGGGAMLNLGFYPVQWATLAFGGVPPDRLVAAGRLSPSGVDLQGSTTLVWDQDGLASTSGVATLTFGFCCNTGETCDIVCEKGRLRIETPADAPTKLSVVDRTADPFARPGGFEEEQVMEFPLQELPYHSWPEPRVSLSYPHGEGMMYEVQHVEECLTKGSILPDEPAPPATMPPVEAEEMPELPRLMGRISLRVERTEASKASSTSREEDYAVYQRALAAERERQNAWQRWASGYFHAAQSAKDFTRLADRLEPGWRISKPILCCTTRSWCMCKEESLDVRSSKAPYVMDVEGVQAASFASRWSHIDSPSTGRQACTLARQKRNKYHQNIANPFRSYFTATRRLPNCAEGVVTKDAWRALVAWYDLCGPALPRKVIEIEGHGVELEMYPLCLHISRTDQDGNIMLLERTLEISRTALASEAKKAASDLHGIEGGDLVLCHRIHQDFEFAEVDEGQTLHALQFLNDNQLLLRVRNAPMRLNGNRLPSGKNHGHVGLQNLGNTCYMNAAIQCLVHSPLLPEYFMSEYKLDVNPNSKFGMAGKLAVAFAELLAEIQQARRAGSNVDSQEFLSMFLAGLSEDVNRTTKKPYRELKDSEGRPDEEVALEYWQSHCLRERSAVAALFSGQFCSVLRCQNCGYTNHSFEAFSFLPIPIPEHSYRWVTCMVVSASRPPAQHITRVCARVPKQGNIKDALEAAGGMLSMEAQDLVAADVGHGYISRLWQTEKSLSVLSDDAQPWIFHAPLQTVKPMDLRMPASSSPSRRFKIRDDAITR
eukprot:symbB.v1.2.013658.t1/scaffold973.1/size147933/3